MIVSWGRTLKPTLSQAFRARWAEIQRSSCNWRIVKRVQKVSLMPSFAKFDSRLMNHYLYIYIYVKIFKLFITCAIDSESGSEKSTSTLNHIKSFYDIVLLHHFLYRKMNWKIHLWLQSSHPSNHIFFGWPGSEGKIAWSWRSHHQRTFSETARREHLAKTTLACWLRSKGNVVSVVVGFCKINKGHTSQHQTKEAKESPTVASAGSQQ